jgi:hypothetical protein
VRAAEARAWEQRSIRGGLGSSLSANSMASRASFQGSTTSSARREAAEATVSDAVTLMARRAGRSSCAVARRSGQKQRGTGSTRRA